jgi:hypothetical protein
VRYRFCATTLIQKSDRNWEINGILGEIEQAVALELHTLANAVLTANVNRKCEPNQVKSAHVKPVMNWVNRG